MKEVVASADEGFETLAISETDFSVAMPIIGKRSINSFDLLIFSLHTLYFEVSLKSRSLTKVPIS